MRTAESQKGIIVVAAAVLLVVIAMAALVTDAGIILVGRSDVSMAVDFAATAGAQELPDTSAAAAVARSYVDLNINRGLYPGATSRVTFPGGNVVRVEADMGLPATFLRALGVDTLDVGAVAEATRLDPDIALIIDRSGSMCQDSHGSSAGCPDDGTPWEPFTTVQATANAFVDRVPGDPTWALVSYASTARLDVRATTNRALIHAAIDNLVPGGATDIAGSVSLAIDQILLTLGRAPKLIVLLTDGRPNRVNGVQASEAVAGQALLDAARYAFSQGIILHGINYGTNVDNDLMRQVAESTEGSFYYAPDEAALQAVYYDIADRAYVRLTYVD